VDTSGFRGTRSLQAPGAPTTVSRFHTPSSSPPQHPHTEPATTACSPCRFPRSPQTLIAFGLLGTCPFEQAPPSVPSNKHLHLSRRTSTSICPFEQAPPSPRRAADLYATRQEWDFRSCELVRNYEWSNAGAPCMLYATQFSKDPHGRSEPPLQRNVVCLLFSFKIFSGCHVACSAPFRRMAPRAARCAHRAPPHAAEPSSCAATSARAARGPTRRASTSASRGASLALSETWRRCNGAPGICAGQTLVKRSRARSQPDAGQTHAAPPRAGVLTGRGDGAAGGVLCRLPPLAVQSCHRFRRRDSTVGLRHHFFTVFGPSSGPRRPVAADGLVACGVCSRCSTGCVFF